jgi:hypothetical protein
VTRIDRVDPVTVVVPMSIHAEEPSVGERISFLTQGEEVTRHCHGTVRTAQKYGGNVVIEVDCGEWQTFERRRAERFSVSLPALVTVVGENADGATLDTIDAEVIDLSQVGAKMTGTTKPARGTLVAVSVQDPHDEEWWRCFGIITRSEPDSDSFGVEFFDFVGTTRFRLELFLAELKKAA